MMFFLGPLGPTELILILVVVLIIFGAGRLPEIGEGLGKGIKSFKKAIKDEPRQIPPSSEEEESPSDKGD